MLHRDNLEMNDLYRQSVEAFQEGRWEEAIKGFEALLEVYPDDETLQTLLNEARGKAALSSVKAGEGARWFRKLLPFAVAVVVLLLIGTGLWAASAYRAQVAERAKSVSARQQAETYLSAGRKALAEGRYDAAEENSQKALELDPTLETAKTALEEVKKEKAASTLYEEATREREKGNLEKSLALFEQLREKYPDYRDVSRQIAEIQRQLQSNRMLQQADEAFEKGDWDRAADLYSSFAKSNPDSVTDEVERRLYTAYLKLGEELIGSKKSEEVVQQAAKMFRNALRWKPRDPKARAYLDMIEKYQEGKAAIQAGNFDLAISILRELYVEQPDFLGGKVADDLYAAYLSRGERYEQAHEYTLAYQQYIMASKLPVDDVSEAKRRMVMLGLFLTPTPTPTPTPEPTPTPAPTPTPGPLSWYKGYIAFLSDRDGDVGLYIMPPSGKWVRRFPDRYLDEYDHLREQERYAPGGKARVYAEGVGEEEQVQLFIWRYDIPQEWGPRRQLTDAPQPDYDPVWSPTGEWIAFVSERTGNDEIWIIRPDGTGLKQLTRNTWEWDKHPSWSPDGKQIVFWSNRKTGRKQIWLMNADGSDQHNISNNKWNDWDPIWIK
jgi:tetratricopeptide (TPR) repeat protein